MASGHDVEKPDTANHPNRKVGREREGGNFGKGEPLIKISALGQGQSYIAMGAVTPRHEEMMTHGEWLSYMTRKHGHSGQ